MQTNYPTPIISQNLKTNTFSSSDWQFTFTTAIITKSTEIDEKAKELNIQHCPEQVFGSNGVSIKKNNGNFELKIDTWDSLSFCNYEKISAHLQPQPTLNSKDFALVNSVPNEIQVKYSEIWKLKRLDEILDVKEMERISDPFFCSPYKGSIIPTSTSYIESTEEDIPIANLTEANPIKWHDHLILWEDELGDNGLSSMDFRFRVMKDCFFGLLRHYLRVDDVAIRIMDTRFYHDFASNHILREFSVRQDSYANISGKGFKFTHDWMTNENQSFIISEFVPIIFTCKDKIFL